MTVGFGWGVIIFAGAVATASVMGRAGILHLGNPGPLAATLSENTQHRWLPVIVRMWGLGEVMLGCGLLAALLWSGPWAVAVSITICAVLLSYTAWLFHRARSANPWCACTAGQTPANLASVVRPLVMAGPVAGLAIFASSGTHFLEGVTPVEAAGTLLAGLGLGLVGWFYPEAVTTTAARQRMGVVS